MVNLAPAPTIVWFREDFRIADNMALLEAEKRGQPTLCIVILDDAHLPGAAARWWLHGAIRSLDETLRGMGGALHVFRGAARAVLAEIVQKTGAGAVFWNRRYDPAGREADTAIKADLRARGLTVRSFPGALLHEPWSVCTRSGAPYKIFTAFWRAACALPAPFPPHPAPERLVFASPPPMPDSLITRHEQDGLLPHHPDWAGGLRDMWSPGEEEAGDQLSDFLRHDGAGYATARDFPGDEATSRLSPFLRFGHVSPAQVWHAATRKACPDKFLMELGWRDFAWSLLFFNPDLATRNLRPEFDAMPWRHDPGGLAAWQRGQTGYPLVDAGMRELWHTGWMHNRVRMVAASFLVKHLLIDWREGERWFADTLVDHDPASNPMNWQWNAGTGVDAAPYFRVMNPILQSRKFDPHGVYIRRWVPELAHLSDDAIHAPWESGATHPYPAPIVDHRAARERALAAWKMI
ncbi:deoxyribodipyrimidine photo-lyase [Gluconacetobacter diazotrophicus]|uniref:Deoxyribodipyrimidine photo-lyase n=1 Tax=Gluconacetobacter diazotrophicus TaxID=33996 RepID=A0A7W4I7N6_GLUDI|nr:deoxyribodipyrimidine photo-lyase [Gluconacetobacter diazotrophicus]MBB2157787.1 deoxyribodipyrimidine photo-lyase [Gluconacetobacter diazotrophicus]